jgi:RNA polymerase sigma-70 factor (ECF subfamily)
MSSAGNEIAQQGKRIRAFIGGRIGPPNDADDLTQETFLKAFRGVDSLRDKSRVEAWLYRIARRTIVDYYRRRPAPEKLGDPAAASTDTHLERVTAAVTCSALCYLGTLPDEYRQPVLLADYEGLSHSEIAQRLGISLSATKSRVRRGRQRVRELMEDCCRMVYDARGKIIDYELRRSCPTAGCRAK